MKITKDEKALKRALKEYYSKKKRVILTPLVNEDYVLWMCETKGLIHILPDKTNIRVYRGKAYYWSNNHWRLYGLSYRK